MLRQYILIIVSLRLMGWGTPAHGQTSAEDKQLPKAIVPEVVQAWEKTGAKRGWLQADCFVDYRYFEFAEHAKRAQPLAGEVPAFLISYATAEMLDKLPQPEVPFGIVVTHNYEEVHLKKLGQLKQLQALRIYGSPRFKSGTIDKELKHLAELKLRSLVVAIESGEGIQDWPELRYLAFRDNHLSDEGMKKLAALKNLQTLNLGQTNPRFTDAGVKHLAALTQLEKLDLQNVKLTDACLHALAGMTKLRYLDLSNNRSNWTKYGPHQFTDKGFAELAGLQQLEYLDLGATSLTDESFKTIGGLKNLRALYGSGRMTDNGLKYLAGLDKLRTFRVPALITDAGLKELASLKNLEHLDLSYCPIAGSGLKELAGLERLESLNLEKTKVTGEGLKALAGLKQLRKLNLSNTRFTDAGMKELGELTQLQELRFEEWGASFSGGSLTPNVITDLGVKELANLKDLRLLLLNATKVTDESVKTLATLKNLKVLSVGGTKITPAGLSELKKALPQAKISG